MKFCIYFGYKLRKNMDFHTWVSLHFSQGKKQYMRLTASSKDPIKQSDVCKCQD